MSHRSVSTLPRSMPALLRSTAGIVFSLSRKIAFVIERSKDRRALGKLNDYLLKDIGIARADIERIVSRRN